MTCLVVVPKHFATIALIVAIASPQSLAGQDTSHVVARRIAARQVNADLFVAGLTSNSVQPEALAAERAKLDGFPLLTVWRVTAPSAPHLRSYVIVQIGSEYYRGGGFSGPQLVEIALAVARRSDSNLPVEEVADLLLQVSDEAGVGVVTARTEGRANAEARRAWAARPTAPLRSGGDSVHLHGGEVLITRESIAPRRVHGAPGFWVPVRSVFVFGADGRLHAWRTEEDTPYRATASR